jgi:NAD(P)H-dependent flavin oxidoreductase YrpB (nitropropane dioxygenase family)
LSQAISEGDGISLILGVRGPEDARRAEERGAVAVLVDEHAADVRAATSLPLITSAGTDGDARLVCPGDEDLELRDGVELVVRVEREEELEEALERLDPELVVLAAPELEQVLDLLSDVPAGKLAIADLTGATQTEIDELERAGVDAVLLRDAE